MEKGWIVKVTRNCYIAKDKLILDFILSKIEKITQIVEGRITRIKDSDFYILRFWTITNRYVFDKKLKEELEIVDKFLEKIENRYALPPDEIIEGHIEDDEEDENFNLILNNPTLTIEKDPNGAYGTLIHISNDYLSILSYDCSIEFGIGEWKIRRYKIATIL